MAGTLGKGVIILLVLGGALAVFMMMCAPQMAETAAPALDSMTDNQPDIALVFAAETSLEDDLKLAVDYSKSHGPLKHGALSIEVQKCLEKPGGTISVWKKDGKILKVCQLPNRLYGVQVIIENTDEELTSFCKEKMKTLEQVYKYLRNGGAEMVQ